MLTRLIQKAQASPREGFSLAEAVIGIGLAAMLILSIIGLTTASLRGDQVAEIRQLALARANAELNKLGQQVSVVGTPARVAFWNSPDGLYTGPGTIATAVSNKVEFNLSYRCRVLLKVDGTPVGAERPRNRIKKVDLIVSWWEGNQGTPGYGKLSVTASRLIRESDVREP